MWRSYSYVLLFLLTIPYSGFGQEDKNSVSVRIDPFHVTLNKDDLSYDPFGEYGFEFVHSSAYGIAYHYQVAPKFRIGAILDFYIYEVEGYSFNPFPSFDPGEWLSQDWNSRLTTLRVGPQVEAQFISAGIWSLDGTAMFSLLLSGHTSRSQKDVYAPSTPTQSATEMRVSETKTTEWSKPVSGVQIGIANKFDLRDNLRVGLGVVYGIESVPGFLDVQERKKQLYFPLTVSFMW